ncbi:MAG: hypothetical protein P8H62_13180 [Henriciella sp.]|nr:hypothetical protein [Henriciella sp.]
MALQPTAQDNADEAKRPVPKREGGPASAGRYPLSEEITHELQHAQQVKCGVGTRHPREKAKKLFYNRDSH